MSTLLEMKNIANEEQVLYRNPGQAFSIVDGEVIMLSIENEEYYALNEVGSAIWSHLEEPRSINEIIDLLLHDFEIDRESCMVETQVFIEELMRMGLLLLQKG